MRVRIASVVLALGTALVIATPAAATIGVVIDVPAAPIYSPFDGPATVTFAFDGTEPATVFTLRLRRSGHGVVRERDVLIDPGSQSAPHAVAFTWPSQTVGNPTGYVVDVQRQNGATVTSQAFTLLPPLASGLTATPPTFYPLLQDGFRDTTTIGYELSADTSGTVLRVHAADVYGRCCGDPVRTVDLGPLPLGEHTWVWDGMRDDASPAAKGRYFARVEATDTGAITMMSRATEVELTTGIVRLRAIMQRQGSAYRIEREWQTAIGGDCLLSRDTLMHIGNVLCANAAVELSWRWPLDAGERIERVSFAIDGGYYGCRRRVDHTRDRSTLVVLTPPTSTCAISAARIVYSYPVQA